MKTILIASLVFASLSSFAAPAPETEVVSRLLVNNPDVVVKLNKANIKAITDLKAEAVKPGVTKFTLHYERSCFCVPAIATVTITEDLTPTFSDGAAVYEANVEILEAH